MNEENKENLFMHVFKNVFFFVELMSSTSSFVTHSKVNGHSYNSLSLKRKISQYQFFTTKQNNFFMHARKKMK